MSYDADRLAFYGDYADEVSQINKTFLINFYTIDNSIEMYDLRRKKLFLRRTKIPGIEFSNDLFIGAIINIFGKTIIISDYGDLCTRRQLSEKRQKTFLMILPGAINDIADILITLDRNRLVITNLQMIKLEALEIVKFCSNNNLEQNLPTWLDHLSSGPIVAIQIYGDNAIEQLEKICGPDNIDEARKRYPNSLRAKYGVDSVNSGVFCSHNSSTNIKNLDFFFSKQSDIKLKTTAQFNNSALLVIKPHAVKEFNTGNILALISSGFRITAMKMITMDRKESEIFFEIYRGVVPEFLQMVDSLVVGPCIAVELISNDLKGNTQQSLREFCGPSDTDVAKVLRPACVRAIYGSSKILNAVHCTDLVEETILELEKLFQDVKF